MTKKAIKEECQRILYKWKGQGFIAEPDKSFVLSVLMKHTQWSEKWPYDCEPELFVSKSEGFNTFCFYLYNFNAYYTHISFYESLRPSTKRSRVLAALRNADLPRILKFRENTPDRMQCPITGRWVKRASIEVDHYDRTFAEIADEWIEEHGGLDEVYGLLHQHSGEETTERFEDIIYNVSFAVYAANNSKLRFLSKEGNKMIIKRNKN